jgi:hypothetical protein
MNCIKIGLKHLKLEVSLLSLYVFALGQLLDMDLYI